MPSSRFTVIPTILSLVISIKPKSILDIGIGSGKYGMLFREYLDLWDVSTPCSGRSVWIAGVEIFEEYRNPVWEMYDDIMIGNALDIEKIRTEYYDLVFLGDVLEHFDMAKGRELLNSLNCNHIIIATPYIVTAQKAVYGNENERHVSSWRPEDLPSFQLVGVTDNTQVYYKRNQ